MRNQSPPAVPATAAPPGRREPVAAPRPAGDIVVDVVRTHAASLLALARRHSLCADDAHDAYQRALEIFLRRVESLEPATMVSWLRTVVKHEAMAVRAQRQALVAPAETDLDRHPAGQLPSHEERVARFERLGRAAEALGRLKPHEVRALLLKAEGHSYQEICAITGWSYTKVNRCLTEGRKAFRDRYAEIEAGAECARWTPVLSAVADGEASAEQLLAVRPHLRACPACRATVREFHQAPHEVAAVLPLGAVLAAGAAAASGREGGLSGLLARAHELVVGGLPERVVASAQKVQMAMEAATGAKVAAVAASTVALAGGGLVARDELRGDRAGRGSHGAAVHHRLAGKGVTPIASPLRAQAADPGGRVALGMARARARAAPARASRGAGRQAPRRQAAAASPRAPATTLTRAAPATTASPATGAREFAPEAAGAGGSGGRGGARAAAGVSSMRSTAAPVGAAPRSPPASPPAPAAAETAREFSP